MSKKTVKENTTSGSIASVAMPLGGTQKRAGSLFKGKKTKKKFYEGKMKDLAYDILYMDAGNFVKKYGKPKEAFTKNPEKIPRPPMTTKEKPPVSEAELSEQDLILLPGQIKKRDKSFIPHDKDRRDHEVEMARSDMYAAAKDAMRIYKLIQNRSEDEGLMGWQQSYITLAADYLNSVADSLEHHAATEGAGVLAGGGSNFEEGVAEGSKMARHDKLAKAPKPKNQQEWDFIQKYKADLAKSYLPKKTQDVTEGAPELLKKEMPLVRHIDKILAGHGYKKGTPEYDEHFKQAMAYLRKFGNIDLINKQGVAEGLESFGAVKFRPKTMFQRKVEYYMTKNNIPDMKDKEFHRDPDLKPMGYNWAYYKKNGRVYLELAHHYYRKSGGNNFVEPKNSKKYSYFLVNKDYSLTPLHNVSEGFQNVGVAEGFEKFKIGDKISFPMSQMVQGIIDKIADNRIYVRLDNGDVFTIPQSMLHSVKLIEQGVTEGLESVKEEFKNTYNVGDKVKTPLGNGTIVLVPKTVNVDGKVKVKLDDPSRAGEDGKHKDTFVFTTSMLKHLSEHKSVKEGRKYQPPFVSTKIRNILDNMLMLRLKAKTADERGKPKELEAIKQQLEDLENQVLASRRGQDIIDLFYKNLGSKNDNLIEKKDACYNKVKSRYKVWPSAYASGALVKCRKVGASNWGKKTTKEARGDGQQGVGRGSYQRHSKGLESLIDEWLLLYTQRNTALYMSQMNKAESLFNKMQEIETEMLAKNNGKEELDKLKTYVRKKL